MNRLQRGRCADLVDIDVLSRFGRLADQHVHDRSVRKCAFVISCCVEMQVKKRQV